MAIILLLVAAAAVPAVAQQPALNSERIEQIFGSYGIDVVFSDDGLRLSNLYSLHDGRKITRTFAIVSYPDEVNRAFRDEHEAILAGGSIGAVFKAAGWDVVKTEHHYFPAGLPDAVAAGMRQPAGKMVAAHAYRLSIEKGRRHFDYALIIEIHHPDYLTENDLEMIYGEQEVPGMAEPARRALVDGEDRLSRFGLALGQ